MKLPQKILARQHEITEGFFRELEAHLNDIESGRADRMYEIRDLAARLHIHPTHLSNTIKLTTGKSPCDFFEQKLMDIARRQLADFDRPITQIAAALTFDPSNFTKFFKRFQGVTPRQYREDLYAEKLRKTA